MTLNRSVYTNDEPLPPEEEMCRSDALDAFIAVANTVQPDHPYTESPYPVTRDDVDFGVTRTCLASCGPRGSGSPHKIEYNTRMTAINELTRERHLALLVHEATHVSVGGHSSDEHGSHPPRFWKKMAFNAVLVHDSLQEGRLAGVFPDAGIKKYIVAVCEDPNSATVDRRYWTVRECKDEVHDIVGFCINYEHSYDCLPESRY